jgi:uncharacterized phage protein gp47/JayE
LLSSGYGITDTGYNKRDYKSIIDYIEEGLKDETRFGNNIDFSDADPLKQFSVPVAEQLTELWEAVEQVFFGVSPKYAEGNNLSRTGAYIGISRKQPTYSTGVCRFTGSTGVTIPKGFLVSTESGIVFQTTDENKTIDSNGYIDINVQALNQGASGDNAANTIVRVVNPIIGLDNVTNPLPTKGGQDEEADTDFRIRYKESTSLGVGSTADAIRAKILEADDVQDCIVRENDTMNTVDGLKPKSIKAIVYGGADTAIAQAIFSKKAGGVDTNGDTTIQVLDSQQVQQPISFSRPTAVIVYIKVVTTTTTDFPSDGKDKIKSAIESYMSTMRLGQDIVNYQLISIVASLKLDGLTDIQIQTSLDNTTFSSSNIQIGDEEIAITDTNKITVN